MKNYKVEIFWSAKDSAWIATVPAFDGLAVVADTRREALEEAETAIETYLLIYQEDGIPIPPEDYLPSEFSGQVRLRLSKYQHQRSSQRAQSDGVSLNSYFAEAIAARNGIEDFVCRLLDRVSAELIPVVQHQHVHRHFYATYDTKETMGITPRGYPDAVWKGTAETSSM